MSRHQGSRGGRFGSSLHLTGNGDLVRDSYWEWEQPSSGGLPRALTHGGLQPWGSHLDAVVEGDGFTFECTGRARPHDFTL